MLRSHSIQRHLVLIATALVASILVTVTHHLPAAAAVSPVVVEVELVEVTGVEHVAATDVVAITGDNRVNLYDGADGSLLRSLVGIDQASSPVETGQYLVVLAAGTNELVVIDTVARRIVRRIDPGQRGVSSVAAAGETIWYAHGPDQWDAGIGRAQLLQGQGTPYYHTDWVYYRGTVMAAATQPELVYYSASNLTPRYLNRYSGTDILTYPDSGLDGEPVVITPDAQRGWIIDWRNDQLTEFDAFTFETTGRSIPLNFLDPTHLLAPSNQRLAVVSERMIQTYDLGDLAMIAEAHFPNRVVDADSTGGRLFTLTEALSQDQPVKHQLTISGLAYKAGPEIVVVVFAEGKPGTERPTVRLKCDVTDITYRIAYGRGRIFRLDVGDRSCQVTHSGLPNESISTFAWNGSQWVRSRSLTDAVYSGQEFLFIDEYPSPLTYADLFVEQMFNDILLRSPTASELAVWTDLILSRSTTPTAFITWLFDSDEFAAVHPIVSRLYLSYFRRWPESAGLAYWRNHYQTDGDLRAISDFFAGSPEFINTYGHLSDARFVDLVYQNVLGRQPDEAGSAYWRDRLAAGLRRGDMMIYFSESAENVRKTSAAIMVRAVLVAMLERPPTDSESDSWISQYQQTGDLERLITAVYQSGEYYWRFSYVDPLGQLGIGGEGGAQLTHLFADPGHRRSVGPLS